MREVGMYGAALLALGITTSVGAIQTLLTPDNTWIPLGVLVGMLGISIAVTVKVMRLLSKFEALEVTVRKAAKRQRHIAKELDIDFPEEP
jgi:xanthosine utilization system XapX-like protein